MEMTQQDFEDRLARVEDGTADDEDRRLVKHYRREGFTPGDEPADGSWLAGLGGDDAENDDYDAMDYRDLQALARERGLNAGGSGDDLKTRLREQDQQRRDASDAAQE